MLSTRIAEAIFEVALAAEIYQQQHDDEAHRTHRDPETGGVFEQRHDFKIHAEDSGNQRQRHEQCCDDRQGAHDFAGAVRHRRKVYLHRRFQRCFEAARMIEYAADVFHHISRADQ